MNHKIESETSRDLLKRWALNTKRSQYANSECGRHFSRMHTVIGVPVVVLTSIVGTSIFASMEADVNNEYRVLLALISVIAAVLASLQTFLNYSDRASRHRSASAEYGAIKRHIQELLTKTEVTSQEISSIRDKMNMLAKDAPEIPGKFLQRATEAVPEVHQLTKQINADP